jgi:hypothetical protein
MRRIFVILSVITGCSLLLVSCEELKSATPLSPSIAGPIAGVQITEPAIVSPADGSRIASDTQPITFMVSNADTSGVRPLTYALEIAVDGDFKTKVFSQTGITPGDGKTSYRLPQSLGAERVYYWRVRAYDGANDGDYSPAMSFTVFTPVVIGVPGLSSPPDGGVTTSLKPILEVFNAPVSGPAGQMHVLFEVATDAAMANRIYSVDALAGSSRTAYGIPSDLVTSTRYYWRVRAFDNANHAGNYSNTFSFVTPAPVVVTPPPGESGPTTAPGDQIDMKAITVVKGADFRGWAVTSTMTSVTRSGTTLCTDHTKSGRWPAIQFFDSDATIEGNQWFIVSLGGRWYAGADEWLRPGQICKDVGPQVGHDGFGGTVLENWTPSPGELMGIAVSAPARAGQQGLAERSNVVLFRW